MSKERLLIIGIDGIPYRLMENFSEKGIMPNFQKLKIQGFFKKMESSIPEISSVAWSSVITGKNPGEHGIYGFTELMDETYSLSFPNFNDLKEKAFWQRDDKKYVIINVPSTYPAKELNGFLVSGFVSLDLEKAVYPASYIQKLKNFDYKIDVDSEKAHTSKELFLEDLFDTLEKRVETHRHLWNEFNWDVFMFVITGSDRIGHFLWNAFEDENHEFHKEFLRYFQKVDEIIGEIVNKMKRKDSLIILSDHGMESIEYDVFLNTFLMTEGFLDIEVSERINYNSITEKTKAFVLDPSRVYLHTNGKYPKGTVKKEDEESIIKELIEKLEALEKDGKKVIKKIYRKEEIYIGPYLENAPDLVLLPNKGFNLRGALGKQDVFESNTTIFEGHHTHDDAFLFVNTKKKIVMPENPKVHDVVKVIDQLL